MDSLCHTSETNVISCQLYISKKYSNSQYLLSIYYMSSNVPSALHKLFCISLKIPRKVNLPVSYIDSNM